MFGLRKKGNKDIVPRSYGLHGFDVFMRDVVKNHKISTEKTAVVHVECAGDEIFVLLSSAGNVVFAHSPDKHPLNIEMFSFLDPSIEEILGKKDGCSAAERELLLSSKPYMVSHGVQVCADFWRKAVGSGDSASIKLVSEISEVSGMDDFVSCVHNELTDDKLVYIMLGAGNVDHPAVVSSGKEYTPVSSAESFVVSTCQDRPVTFAELRDNLNGFAWKKDVIPAISALKNKGVLNIVEGDEYIPGNSRLFTLPGMTGNEEPEVVDLTDSRLSSDSPVLENVITGGISSSVLRTSPSLFPEGSQVRKDLEQEEHLGVKVGKLEEEIVPLVREYDTVYHQYVDGKYQQEFSVIELRDQEDFGEKVSVDDAHGLTEMRDRANNVFEKLRALEEQRDGLNAEREKILAGVYAWLGEHKQQSQDIVDAKSVAYHKLEGIEQVESVTWKRFTKEEVDNEREAVEVLETGGSRAIPVPENVDVDDNVDKLISTDADASREDSPFTIDDPTDDVFALIEQNEKEWENVSAEDDVSLLEDAEDVQSAAKVRAEGGKNIPFEKVMQDLNLDTPDSVSEEDSRIPVVDNQDSNTDSTEDSSVEGEVIDALTADPGREHFEQNKGDTGMDHTVDTQAFEGSTNTEHHVNTDKNPDQGETQDTVNDTPVSVDEKELFDDAPHDNDADDTPVYVDAVGTAFDDNDVEIFAEDAEKGFPASTLTSQTPPWAPHAPSGDNGEAMVLGYKEKEQVSAPVVEKLDPLDNTSAVQVSGFSSPAGTIPPRPVAPPPVPSQYVAHGVRPLSEIPPEDFVYSTPLFEQIVKETGFRPGGK